MPFLTFCCFYCSEIIKGFSKGGCSDISKGKRPLEYNFVYTVPPPAAEPPKHEVLFPLFRHVSFANVHWVISVLCAFTILVYNLVALVRALAHGLR